MAAGAPDSDPGTVSLVKRTAIAQPGRQKAPGVERRRVTDGQLLDPAALSQALATTAVVQTPSRIIGSLSDERTFGRETCNDHRARHPALAIGRGA